MVDNKYRLYINNIDNHMQGTKVTVMVTDNTKVPNDMEVEVKEIHDGYGGDRGRTTTTTCDLNTASPLFFRVSSWVEALTGARTGKAQHQCAGVKRGFY